MWQFFNHCKETKYHVNTFQFLKKAHKAAYNASNYIHWRFEGKVYTYSVFFGLSHYSLVAFVFLPP